MKLDMWKRRGGSPSFAQAGRFKAAPSSSRTAAGDSLLLRLAGWSFYAAVFFAPFRFRWTLFRIEIPQIYRDYTDGLVFAADLFLAVALILWLVDRLLRPRRLSLGSRVLAIPLAGLMTASALSAVFSVLPAVSFYHLGRLLLVAGMYIYIVNEGITLRRIFPAVAGSVAVQAAVGVTQWLLQSDLGLQRLGEYELDPTWGGVSIVWAEGVRSLRAYGLSDHPNILGGLLAFSLVLMLARMLLADRSWRVWGSVWTGVFSLGLAGLFLTFSRSAWLGFITALGLGAVLLWRSKRKVELLSGVALLAAGLIILSPFVWRSLPLLGVRLNQGNSFEEVPYEKSSLVERAALNQAANDIFAQNALTGVGLGTFPVALRAATPDFPYFFQPPHLVFLAAAAETGLFGASFYGLAQLAPWVWMWVHRRRLEWTADLIGASMLLLAIGIVSLLDYYPWLLAPGRFWQWLAWGLWAAAFADAIQEV